MKLVNFANYLMLINNVGYRFSNAMDPQLNIWSREIQFMRIHLRLHSKKYFSTLNSSKFSDKISESFLNVVT